MCIWSPVFRTRSSSLLYSFLMEVLPDSQRQDKRLNCKRSGKCVPLHVNLCVFGSIPQLGAEPTLPCPAEATASCNAIEPPLDPYCRALRAVWRTDIQTIPSEYWQFTYRYLSTYVVLVLFCSWSFTNTTWNYRSLKFLTNLKPHIKMYCQILHGM